MIGVIAKLVYNSHNYGLWMFMVYITIVFMGVINQLISRGPHLVGKFPGPHHFSIATRSPIPAVPASVSRGFGCTNTTLPSSNFVGPQGIGKNMNWLVVSIYGESMENYR